MGIVDIPPPVVGQGRVLVRTCYSVISSGTEGATVSAARKSLIGKAKERPDQLKKVFASLKQQGPRQTYRAVMKKLGSYSPLGYSASGEVIDVSADVQDFSIGDLVACAGAGYANHAEINAVPANLCAKLPVDADLSKAAYGTLGAIALQGLRQADLKLGETCVVIGLGLLGHLSALMLRANGVKVIGLDIDDERVALAVRTCCDYGFVIEDDGVPSIVAQLTRGIGADAVIITAATSSLTPINLAGRLLRQRGTVVIVGAVPVGFKRDPHYYKKELSLKMSCSYGPGRYDPMYEEKGVDYPVGYVRWTEKRNMEAFQDLVYSGRIDVSYLTTHRFAFEEAPMAYEIILKKQEKFLGILIEFAPVAEVPKKNVATKAFERPLATGRLGLSFIGAGSYAMSHLLPNIRETDNVVFRGVLSASGTSSRTAAEKYGFEFCTSKPEDIFESNLTTTVFVATRHDTHAGFVIEALKHDKQVFVEKPLCLNEAELRRIEKSYLEAVERSGRACLMVGFNRRFSPLAVKLKHFVGSGPLAILYRVNAGAVPADSWIQDREIGGGRIIGEVCHFLDFITFLTGALPVRVFAVAMEEPDAQQDVVSLTVSYSDGSIATIGYYANGSKMLPKEYIEVYRAEQVAVLNDFKELVLYGNSVRRRFRMISQDKGQANMLDTFVRCALGQITMPLEFQEICAVTRATFAAVESLRKRVPVQVSGVPLSGDFIPD